VKRIVSLFLILLSANIVVAQITRVAILDFDNISGIAKYDGLGKAMSSMLISDIEANVSPKRLQLVERAQIQKILKEQNFQASSNVNKATAVQVGKLLGVSYLLVGDVYILNDQLVINARLTNTETGDIIFSKKQEGKTIGWLTLKTNVAKELAISLSQPFNSPTIPDIETPVATVTTYGNAIKAKDEGDLTKAENLIETVRDFNPEFKYVDELKAEMEVLKKSIQQLQKTSNEINDKQNTIIDGISNLNSVSEQLLKELNPKKIIFSDEMRNKINNQLSSGEYLKYKIDILDCYSTVEKIEAQLKSDAVLINIKNLRKEVANKLPNTDIGYFSRAYFEQLNGNKAMAIALNDSATAVNPLFWPAYWKNGMMQNSLEYLDKAIKAEPNSIIAREARALYYQVTHPSSDVAFKVTQARADYQKCYEITNHPKYKLMECGLYYDFKYWSGLCPLVNSSLREKMIATNLFQEKKTLMSPIFAICDNDPNAVNLKNLTFDKAQFSNKKILLHLSYNSLNTIHSARYNDQYYFSIEAIGSNQELQDFSSVDAITIVLYFNKRIFENQYNFIKSMKKGDIFSVIATLDTKEKYTLTANVDWFETFFISFNESNIALTKDHTIKDGVLELNNVGEKNNLCISNSIDSKNYTVKMLLDCLSLKSLDEIIEIYNSNLEMLNNVSWLICNNSNNTNDLMKALKMAERAAYISFETNHNIIDTYAFALLKNGQKEKSQLMIKKAIELAKLNNDLDGVKKYENKLSSY
jgi:TolB-like protein